MHHLASLRMIVAASVLALSLAACQSPQPDEQESAGAQAQRDAANAATPAQDTAPEAPPIGTCDASQLQSLVGQPLTDALSAQAKEDAKAGEVRVLKPGEMVTMEFNGDRLNLEVDEKQVITGVRCG
ncbi:Elastase inhibitor AFLEI Flags: Precursor [Stenotrophomonas panacihumi]|uniref:Peptidase inhibitor I78 family protein n=1 Tax=Stenotrophomonas panacihumi TaxID=676599 RepID=A0A0Q9ZXT6_9GAMM|nr:I78 family peptidase inhibitor [Stenotrophomonas panacihumi]KRG37708.1 Elastase inhibitor AFLEI Flags: Precursor [Stenotrophomonas panacihumi]PTN56116.1 Elastase inhibitor AFLEI Flags: Precursor [Stenotrophomonas panacihumi]